MSSGHTRAAILAACRRRMQAGRLGLTMRACYEWLQEAAEAREPEAWAVDRGSTP
jgi:hypothetical protein